MLYAFLKQLLFLLPPERAHYMTMGLFKLGMSIPGLSYIIKSSFKFEDPQLKKQVLGIDFPNPIGLAAGFDKNGQWIELLSTIGFGFIEVGTVTPVAQAGNPKPRLFRLKKDEAIINRMGFNNEGIDALVKNLKDVRSRNKNIIIGGNIGKNKLTPNENAKSDYLICFEALYPLVDYFVVNVSSPNTPNLRALQEKEPLMDLLQSLIEKRKSYKELKPILLKIAPDVNEFLLNDIIDITNELSLDGIIAANTTIDRTPSSYDAQTLEKIGAGGLSGKIMKDKSTAIIKQLRAKTKKETVIIGVGGISNPEEAKIKLAAGADLIQIYTGLIYEGPQLIKKIKAQLV